jgi:hypothetical protein
LTPVIVEHQFVSTLPTETVLDRAEAALRGRGFEPARGKDSLRASRGRLGHRRSRPLTQWALSIDVDYDRGRVVLVGNLDTQRSEPAAAATYLRALARAVEAGVAGEPASADPEWDRALATVDAEWRRRRRLQAILWAVVLTLLAAFLGLFAFATIQMLS